MAGLDDVLERLVADPSFRQRLAADPSAALAGYDLSDEDRALLASQVTDVAGTGGKVEARASRASMAGLLGALEGLADASAELGTVGEPDPSPAAGDGSGKWINLDSYNVGGNQAGDGAGHDVLLGGAGADDPIPTAPSGSGYNEFSLQDTSGRETAAPINLAADLASDDGVPPSVSSPSPAPIESMSTDHRPEPLEVHHVMLEDLLISPVQVGGHMASDAPPDGVDALQWDPGDGSDVGPHAEQIEIESWSPGAPTSSIEPGVQDEVAMSYKAIEFAYDAPAIGDLMEPEAGDPEPTGPIADVLYSAGGSTAQGVSGDDGSSGTGVDKSLDGGATWVEGAEPGGDGDAAFEHADSNANGDGHEAETPEGSLAAGPDDGTSQESISLNFEKIRVTYEPAQAGGGPTQAPDAIAPVAGDGESAARPLFHDLLVTSYQHSGSGDDPAQDGVTDLVVGAGLPDDSANASIVDAAATPPAETIFDYPGSYAQPYDSVGESGPDVGLDVLIAGHPVQESEDTVPVDEMIGIGGDADRSAGQGGGIINTSSTMTLAGSTLAQSDDAVPLVDWAGDDATARSLADPAPAATDGWVNVGQTEQFLFGNTDIAEPEIEDVAPVAREPEPSQAVVGDLNAFDFSDRPSADADLPIADLPDEPGA
ncbi:MAG: hypothetical protein L0221_09030 [Chloroflexi bacterium]|nr:hypothetical protein [Chloroflexota bacterium]